MQFLDSGSKVHALHHYVMLPLKEIGVFNIDSIFIILNTISLFLLIYWKRHFSFTFCEKAVMDALVEDDICILNHEKAHRRETVTPISIYSGDESVASHFALVTAYEDIKKRLKDSEKENSFLKKRIRFLEEKVITIYYILWLKE